MIKQISIVISIILGLAAIGGLIVAERSKFARAGDVLKVRTEIQLMQQEYRTRFTQMSNESIANQKRAEARDLDKRIWTIEQRYLNTTMDQTTQEMLHDMRMRQSELRRQGY